MSKTIKTYSLDAEIAENFKEQTESGKTSQKLEELMAEYLDGDMEQNLSPLKLPGQDLTKKRKDLLQTVFENELFKMTRPQIAKKVKSEGLYTGDSGPYHFKQAMKALLNDEDIPVKLKNDKLVASPFNCMNEGCGRKLTISSLARNDYECQGCGRRYEW